jgi:hypothetical protein
VITLYFMLTIFLGIVEPVRFSNSTIKKPWFYEVVIINDTVTNI